VPTQDEVAEYQRRHGLSYHVPYALEAESQIGLRGKAVIEIGGSLPERFVRDALGVRGWFAIEEMAYWHEMQGSGGAHGNPPDQGAVRRVADATPGDAAAAYGVFAGRVEELPDTLHGQFDAAFSIAAFEHIDRLALTLDGIHAALRPGGLLFSMFSPIWSAHDGHHLPVIRDRQGREFNFARSPIPPWGHLMMRPPELFQYLLAHTDRETAGEIVYYVHHSPHINRLFTEDYVAYCQQSEFELLRCDATFAAEVPPDLQRELERRHPGYRRFKNNGMLVILRKRGGS
jgi:SAM-dependent methyltransferase